MHKRIFILILLLFVFTFKGHCETFELSSEKRADILKLMEMTGVGNVASQIGNTMAQRMFDLLIKASRRDVPQRAVEIIKAEMTIVIEEETKSGRFLDYIVPVYDKYYSHEEIRALIDFYNTDLGRKIINVTPHIAEESMMAGRKWGESMGQVFVERLKRKFKEEGIDLKN